MSKGIALCGKGQIREACSAFDLALKMATGDSTTHNLISLMKVRCIFLPCSVLHYGFQAVAIFYANEREEAIMCVKDMAEFSVDSDLLTCNVVLVSINSGSRSETDCSALRASDILVHPNGIHRLGG